MIHFQLCKEASMADDMCVYKSCYMCLGKRQNLRQGRDQGFFLGGGQEFFDPGTGRLEHFEASYNSS